MSDNNKNLNNEAAESVAGGNSPEKIMLSADDFIEIRSMYANQNQCSKEEAEKIMFENGYYTYPENSHIYITNKTQD